jgi:hypothetical protein
VGPFSEKRVEDQGEGSGKRFAFAGLHFRDTSVVQKDPAEDLHIVVPHVHLATASFAY